MIKSFKCTVTENFFQEGLLPPKCGWKSVKDVARRKLDQLEQATRLEDLALPGNRLEKLHGDRDGQRSIRINEKWRVCFRWIEVNAEDVEICDYHK